MAGHDDHRELGFGNVDARPDVDGTGTDPSGGGQSGGGARVEPVPANDGEGAPGGQTDPAYRGGANPNSPRRSDDA